MSTTTRLDAARRLTAAGYRVIPIGPNKTPAIPSWKPFQDPSSVPNDSTLAAWFGDDNTVKGFGVLGGVPSGNLTVLDFDCPNGLPADTAEKTYQAWRERVGDEELLSRLPVIATPSGGLHVYCRCDEPVAGNAKLAYLTTPDGYRIGIETRGEGGYVVGPGSHPGCHPNGGQYVQHEGPRLENAKAVSADELEAILSVARTFDEKPAPEPARAYRWQDGPADEGRPGDDYNARTTWAEVLEHRGFALVNTDGNGLSYWRRPGSTNKQSLTTGQRENGRDLAYAFSPNCGVPTDVGLTRFTFVVEHDHAGDFREASRQLAANGYGREPDSLAGVDLSRLVGKIADDAIDDGLDVVDDPGSIPAELLDVPGFLGKFIQYAITCGPKPQPELALSCGLVCLGALVGRKVIFPPDGRANVFCMNLAGSSAGKKAAMKAAKNIDAAMSKRLAVPSRFTFSGLPKSDAGVMGTLATMESVAWLIDEMGDFLDAVGSPRAPSHAKAIVRIFVDAYTSSDDPEYTGGAYADEKNQRTIAAPNLNCCGASTTKRFVEALSEAMKDGGFVGRLLVFRGDENAKFNNRREIDEAAERWLVDYATEWHTWKPCQLFDMNPDPAKAIVDESAIRKLEAWQERCESRSKEREDEVWRSVWGRGCEKASKLALLHAASHVSRPDRETVHVADESIAWGIAVADHGIRTLLFLLDRFASDSKSETILKDVRRKLDRFPDGVVPRNKLTRLLQRYSQSERESAIATLCDSEELFRHQPATTQGRPKVVYYRPDAYRKLVEAASTDLAG